MPFERRILHHGSDPGGVPQLLSLTALRSCWFELHRQGGCGAAELVLADDFELRNMIEVGDWISLEGSVGVRWYLGRVEERRAEVPARIRLRLEGMAIELNQVFPGGFGAVDGAGKPHRYGASDRFSADPDRDLETTDVAGTADEVVRLLMTQYVTHAGHIQYLPALVESPALASPVISLKLRGEESVRSLLKDLAVRAQSASWGVDPQGKFYFLKPRETLLVTYRQQRDLVALAETRDVEYLFNRLLLTGDYVYDQALGVHDVARRAYRWRGNFFEPESRSQYGDRRLKIWLPWIRTQEDSLSFAREFFRAYARPVSRFLIETTPQTDLPFPWLGRVVLQDVDGAELVRSRIETIRVLFDHLPRFRLELGPEDPRNLWPEPPQDERWELPSQRVSMGGPVSGPLPVSSGGGGGGAGGTGDSSMPTPDSDSWSSSDFSSGASSDNSDGSLSESSGSLSGTDTGDAPTFTSAGSGGESLPESGATETSSGDSSAGSSSSSESGTATSVPWTSFSWIPTLPSTGGPGTHSGSESGAENSGSESSSEEQSSLSFQPTTVSG